MDDLNTRRDLTQLPDYPCIKTRFKAKDLNKVLPKSGRTMLSLTDF